MDTGDNAMDTSDLILRGGDVNDFHACLPLIEKNYGPSVVGSPLFQNHELFDLYGENVVSVVAQDSRGMVGGVSVVQVQDWDGTIVSELCRPFIEDDSNAPLIKSMVETALSTVGQNSFWCLFECFSPIAWQEAAEACGLIPVGYCPGTFQLRERASAMVYYWLHPQTQSFRRPAPELIPTLEPLARTVLTSLGLHFDAVLREDALAYPANRELTWEELDYVSVAKYLQTVPAVPAEILVLLQDTVTPFKMHAERFRFFGVREGDQSVGIIGCNHDTQQQTVTITHLYGSFPAAKGWLCRKLVEEINGWSVNAVQVVLSAFSSRIQKTFDDLGFIPAAYMPAFAAEGDHRLDAVRMIKLLAPYTDESTQHTAAGKALRNLVEEHFRAYDLGLSVVRLMKGLHAFRGLGDGEILHILESAAQKLYRKGEQIFAEGETQVQMFVVIRGEVHITIQAAGERVLDRLQTGSIFGELAFLNGKPRTATATAVMDSLLLVIDRHAFDQLVQREQHLGLTVFNNIALDLSEKLRASTSHLFHK